MMFLTIAYLDPGTGSCMFQLLAGGILVFLAGFGAVFGRLRSFFRAGVKRNRSDAGEDK